MGAARGINYKTQDFVKEVLDATGGRGVDVVLVAGDYIGRDIQRLADDGRIVIIASGRRPCQWTRRRSCVAGSPSPVPRCVRAPWPSRAPLPARASAPGRCWSRVPSPIVHATFPLAQAAQAHAMMESGENIGKIILTV